MALTLYSEINYIYRATTAILTWFKNFISTTLANLLELDVRKSEFNDNHLLEVSRMCKTLRILSVLGCRITDRGV